MRVNPADAQFTIGPIPVEEGGATAQAIQDRGRTVAFVSAQGYVDWLLPDAGQPGPKLTSVRKEPHLGLVGGLLFPLFLPIPTNERIESLAVETSNNAREAVVSVRSSSGDGRFVGHTQARLRVNPENGRYEWILESSLTCEASGTVTLPKGIEFSNILPAEVGRRFLCASSKRYPCTLMMDRDGVVWRFPHQHIMNYWRQILTLRFAEGAMAGFFGEALNPVVIVDRSPLEPTWGICESYYDLHCAVLVNGPVSPGTRYVWNYRILYMDKSESQSLLDRAKTVMVTTEDFAAHRVARLDISLNEFRDPVRIGAVDEACGFRPCPSYRTWELNAGPRGQGALRLCNEREEQNVWRASADTMVPAGSRLSVSARVKTDAVKGKGFHIRLRPFVFRWRPEMHLHPLASCESKPVAGTTEGWVAVTVPDVVVPVNVPDCELAIELVLEGTGTGWLTDMTMCLRTPRLAAGLRNPRHEVRPFAPCSDTPQSAMSGGDAQGRSQADHSAARAFPDVSRL